MLYDLNIIYCQKPNVILGPTNNSCKDIVTCATNIDDDTKF
jgi:hypothetical protein